LIPTCFAASLEKGRGASLDKVLRSFAEQNSRIVAQLLFPYVIVAVLSYTPSPVMVMAGVTPAVQMSLWFDPVLSILYCCGVVFYALSCRTRLHCTSGKGL